MDRIFREDTTFADLGLRQNLLKGLEEQGFEHPTEIQAKMIPLVLEGRDVLGQAKTGTGKTAAFGLPLIHMVDVKAGPQALILVPTRELAVQVFRELREFAKHSPVTIAAIYGGERKRRQIDRLQKNPQIIVGTPGRIMDLESDGTLSLHGMRYVVLDEVDRMLDIGFRDDIRKILGRIKVEHQTVFVSATISPEIESLARNFMHDAEKVVSTGASLTVTQVEQSHLLVQRWDKRRLLYHLLTHEKPELSLVFCGTKREVDRVAAYLQKKGVDVHAIHGDMYQRKRDRVMQKFRGGDLGVLVASDVAARGLDVEGITHVINYDLPLDPEVYVHRIGRTARIGEVGVAWSFVTPEEGKYLTAIEQLINLEIPRMKYDDFKPGPIPERVREERQRAAELSDKVAAQRSRTAKEMVPTDDARDETKFPGGVVPAAPPKRRMHGRVRGRRR